MTQRLKKVGEIRLSKLVLNMVSFPVFGLACVGMWAVANASPYAVRHSGGDVLWLIVSIAIYVPVHELLHVFALRHRGKAPRAAVKLGFSWKAIMPYCHCEVPVTIGAYRIVALLPLCLTLPAALAAVLFYPALWVILASGAALTGCLGDVVVFVKLRRFPGRYLVQDHPTQVGCDVFERQDDEDCRGRA